MDDTFDFVVPARVNLGEAESGESFGETENFFSVPHFMRHEGKSRRKSAHNAAQVRKSKIKKKL